MDAWPLNIQVITRILSEGDFHYWFGAANISLNDILKGFSYFPSFCGEVYDVENDNIEDTCRRELALWLTFVRFDPDLFIGWEDDDCYDLSENADGECYGDLDMAQIPAIVPTVSGWCYEDEECVGLGPAPLWDDFDWDRFAIDFYGHEDNYDWEDLYTPDMQIAIAVWRHQMHTGVGEATGHDIAIGRWPAEASEAEFSEDTGDVASKSIFELYWCAMLPKTWNGDYDEYNNCFWESQDLWRDLYIWNSMILGVEYEDNGVSSEWYWFDNAEEYWYWSPLYNYWDDEVEEFFYTIEGQQVGLDYELDIYTTGYVDQDQIYFVHQKGIYDYLMDEDAYYNSYE